MQSKYTTSVIIDHSVLQVSQSNTVSGSAMSKLSMKRSMYGMLPDTRKSWRGILRKCKGKFSCLRNIMKVDNARTSTPLVSADLRRGAIMGSIAAFTLDRPWLFRCSMKQIVVRDRSP